MMLLRKSARQVRDERENRYDGGGELAGFVVDDHTDSKDNVDYQRSSSDSEERHHHHHHKQKTHKTR